MSITQKNKLLKIGKTKLTVLIGRRPAFAKAKASFIIEARSTAKKA